jgi:vacuolar protein sorting-associated protein 13A/C
MYEFVDEPFEGIKRGPTEFGKGLVKGTTSLIKNTCVGLFTSVNSLTGSVGNGISHLTMV